ncbi:type 1 glutamine amidotransferase [Arenibacterium sp. LLYu02]|uniref:type 1 glutamine amidotransferase n=1 Tax=Arenibacterium sp. LLYu02 TaxID=3404132 RepID=UPI003B220936
MSDILVIQNDQIGSIGYFGTALEAAGARLTVVRADLGESLSLEEAARFHGLVVLGGRASAFSDAEFPFLPHVLALVMAFQKAEKPVFGICLGAQLLARANGGAFASNNGWEVGFVPLEVTPEAASDPVFGALPKAVKCYELHEDQFRLPEGATLLVTGASCRNQAFRVGAASYGIQFHPAITEEAICAMARDLEGLTDEAGRPMALRMLDYEAEDFVRQEVLCEGLAQRWFALVRARAAALSPA